MDIFETRRSNLRALIVKSIVEQTVSPGAPCRRKRWIAIAVSVIAGAALVGAVWLA